MIGWLEKLLASRKAAKLALQLAREIQRHAELTAAVLRRQGRDAEAGDLEDSLARLRALER